MLPAPAVVTGRLSLFRSHPVPWELHLSATRLGKVQNALSPPLLPRPSDSKCLGL